MVERCVVVHFTFLDCNTGSIVHSGQYFNGNVVGTIGFHPFRDPFHVMVFAQKRLVRLHMWTGEVKREAPWEHLDALAIETLGDGLYLLCGNGKDFDLVHLDRATEQRPRWRDLDAPLRSMCWKEKRFPNRGGRLLRRVKEPTHTLLGQLQDGEDWVEFLTDFPMLFCSTTFGNVFIVDLETDERYIYQPNMVGIEAEPFSAFEIVDGCLVCLYNDGTLVWIPLDASTAASMRQLTPR